MESRKQQKIGFFDSGLGGISVLRDAYSLMPEEDYIYFGDTANAPYGTKKQEQIISMTMNGVDYLLSNNIKALVIACNTATSAAIEKIRQAVSIPVIGMEPAIKPALEHTEGKVLMMATPATVRQEKYQNLLQKCGEHSRVINLPCEKLAGLIEEKLCKGEQPKEYLQELLAPYVGRVDAVVLGCTHYVFVKDLIADIFGAGVELFDGNHGTVLHLKDVLQKEGIKREPGQKGTVVLNSSRDDQYTMKTYARLLFSKE
ncbi:MAG: glutamate racemase [Clostridiales bacterium]|nr:glutamate racemase [Clostridiales bacterium]